MLHTWVAGDRVFSRRHLPQKHACRKHGLSRVLHDDGGAAAQCNAGARRHDLRGQVSSVAANAGASVRNVAAVHAGPHSHAKVSDDSTPVRSDHDVVKLQIAVHSATNAWGGGKTQRSGCQRHARA